MTGADRISLRAVFFGVVLAFTFALPTFAMSTDADLQCAAQLYKLDPNLQSTQINNNPYSPYFGMRGLLGKRCVDVTNEMVTEGKCIADKKCEAVSFENSQGKQQAVGKPDIPVDTKTVPQTNPTPTTGASQGQLKAPSNSNLNTNLLNPTPSAEQQGQVQSNAPGGTLQGIENFAKDGWGKVENIFNPTPTTQTPAQPSFSGSGDLQNAGSVQPTSQPGQQPLYETSHFQNGAGQTFGGGNSFEPETNGCGSWWCGISSAASNAASWTGEKLTAAGDYLFGGPEGSGQQGLLQAGQTDAADAQRKVIASTYGWGNGSGDSPTQKLAAGGTLDQNPWTFAQKTGALGTDERYLFTNPATGDSVVLARLDRGPYVGGRDVDISRAGAEALSMGQSVRALQMEPVPSGTPLGPTSNVPLPPSNPLTADINTSAFPATPGSVQQGSELAPPNPTVAVTSSDLPDVTPNYDAAIPKTEAVNVTPEQITAEANAQLTKDAQAAIPAPDTSAADRSGEAVTQDIRVAVNRENLATNVSNIGSTISGVANNAWDNLKYGWNSLSNYFSGEPGVTPQEAGIPVVQPALSTNDLLGIPTPLTAVPTQPVLMGTNLPAPDMTVPPVGTTELQPQFNNPYGNPVAVSGTNPTNSQVFDTSAPNAAQFSETSPPLPQSRPSDLPINGSEVRSGSDIGAPLSGATDQRLQQSPDTVDIKVPLPPEQTPVPEAIDNQVRAAFDQKIKDANAQIAYAQGLVDAHPGSPTAQALLDESNKRLDAIVSNSISYSAGNPSPDLKAAVDQLQSGAQQGSISGALSALSSKANSDADTIAAGMKTSYDLSTGSGWLSAGKAAWDAGAWGLAKTTSAVADAANDGLSKLGVPGFQNPTADLNNAIDPYGKEYHTASDLAVVAPFGYGAAKSVANAGIDASISAFAGSGRSAIADSALGDAAAPIARDSAGFTAPASESGAIAPSEGSLAARLGEPSNIPAPAAPLSAAPSGSVDSAVRNLDNAVAQVRTAAGNAGVQGSGMADVYANLDRAIADVKALDLPKAPTANVDAAVARLDQAVSDIKAAAPDAGIPKGSVSNIDAAMAKLDDAVAGVRNAAGAPKETPSVVPASPIDNALAKVDQAVNGIKESAAPAEPAVTPASPPTQGTPEIAPQTSRPSIGPGEIAEPQPQSKSWLDTVKSWFTSSNSSGVRVADANPSAASDAGSAPLTPVYDSSKWTGQGFKGFDTSAPKSGYEIPTAEIPVPEGNAAPTLVRPAPAQAELPFGETPQLQPSDIPASSRPSAAVAEPPITEPVAPESNYAVTGKPAGPTVASPSPAPIQEVAPISSELPSPASGFEVPKAVTNPEPTPVIEPVAATPKASPTGGQTEALGESAPAIVNENMTIPKVDANGGPMLTPPTGPRIAASENLDLGAAPDKNFPSPWGNTQPTFAERFGSWASDNKAKVALYGGLGIAGGIAGYDILSSGNSIPPADNSAPDTKDYSTPLPGSAPLGQGAPRSDATAPKPVYDQPSQQSGQRPPAAPTPRVPEGSGEPVGIGSGNSGFNGFLSSMLGSLMQLLSGQSQRPNTPTLPTTPQTPTTTPPLVPTTTISTPPGVVTLIANPTSVVSGKTSKLSWSAVGASTCTLFGPGNTRLGQGSPDGSANTSALATTTPFLVSCATPSGTIYATTSVGVK